MNLPACLFCGALAAITAGRRSEAKQFACGYSFLQALCRFFVQQLCFAGGASERVQSAHDDRQLRRSDGDLEAVTQFDVVRRFERLPVAADVAGLNGCRGQ